MVYNGMPRSNMEDFAFLDDNNYDGESFDFYGFSYLDPSSVAGSSQPYTGSDVTGDWSSYPDFLSPTTTQIYLDSLYPHEGKSRHMPMTAVPGLTL